MPARKRITVAAAKKGASTLSLGGGQDQDFSTKADAVAVGAAEGRANGHAQLIIKAATDALRASVPTVPIHAGRKVRHRDRRL